MNRKDTAVVAVILAAALAAGLGVVGWALHQQQLQQALQFEEAQAAWQEAAGSGGTGGEAGEAGAAGSGTAGEEGAGADGSGAGADGSGAGADGSGAGADGSGSAAGGTGSAAGQMPDLGSPPAVEAGSTMTPEELCQWMTTQSSGALEAETLAASEKAMADGVGTADDALRRTFATSQWAANQEARLNLLEEEAMTLAMTWLQYQQALTLQQENLAWYQALKEEIEASLAALSQESTASPASSAASTESASSSAASSEAASSDTGGESAASSETASDTSGESAAADAAQQEAAAELAARKAAAEADLQKVEQAIAEAELEVKSAQADLDDAQKTLNEAVGLSAEDTLTIAGELTAAELPTLSQEEAVAQGLATRNEIKGALYGIQRAEQELTALRYQAAADSPEVQKQQAALEQAQADYPAAQTAVEADIIDRLTRLGIASDKLALLESQLEDLQPAAYALTGTSSNLAQLMADQAQRLTLQIQLATQTAQFNQDVVQFDHAVGAGTVAAEI